MNDNIQLLINIYMFGRKLKYSSKHNNQDVLMDFCILELIKNGDQKIIDLSTKLYLNLPAISEKIASLEETEMLTKVLGEDKREKHLKLTQKGQVYLDKAYKALDQHCLSFLNVLDDQEKKTLDTLLFKLINS